MASKIEGSYIHWFGIGQNWSENSGKKEKEGRNSEPKDTQGLCE